MLVAVPAGTRRPSSWPRCRRGRGRPPRPAAGPAGSHADEDCASRLASRRCRRPGIGQLSDGSAGWMRSAWTSSAAGAHDGRGDARSAGVPAGPGRRGRWFRRSGSTPGLSRSGRLMLVAHHLVVDGVSWQILLPDLAAAYEALTADSDRRSSIRWTSRSAAGPAALTAEAARRRADGRAAGVGTLPGDGDPERAGARRPALDPVRDLASSMRARLDHCAGRDRAGAADACAVGVPRGRGRRVAGGAWSRASWRAAGRCGFGGLSGGR